MHQASMYEFQKNSNLGCKTSCGGKNTEDALWQWKYREFNLFHVFLCKKVESMRFV